jgi:hypothetical protein
MANSYSPASLDLGLGDGNALTQQLDDEEEKRKKLKMSGMADQSSAGANAMGLAAMNLLGSFRAG